MVSEDHQNTPKYSTKTDSHQSSNDQDDQSEEALSLRDLQIYEDSFIWEEYFSSATKLDHSPDFFEFFTDHATKSPNNNNNSSSNNNNNNNIVFCGKIIPCKGNQCNLVSSTPIVSRQQAREHQKITNQKPKNDNHSLARKSSRRWYLYVFGMVRFPTEMELRGTAEWRSRSLRRRRTGIRSSPYSSSRSSSSSSSSSKVVSFEGNDDECETIIESVSSRSTGVKRFWGLVKALGCRCFPAGDCSAAGVTARGRDSRVFCV